MSSTVSELARARPVKSLAVGALVGLHLLSVATHPEAPWSARYAPLMFVVLGLVVALGRHKPRRRRPSGSPSVINDPTGGRNYGLALVVTHYPCASRAK